MIPHIELKVLIDFGPVQVYTFGTWSVSLSLSGSTC